MTEVTPELEIRFGNLVCNCLLETDQNVRIQGISCQAFEDYGQQIEAALEALHRQLAMGDVAAMMSSSQAFLFGRGYITDLSESDLRRLAYAMAQASLEAYEAMAARQQGRVVNQTWFRRSMVSSLTRNPTAREWLMVNTPGTPCLI